MNMVFVYINIRLFPPPDGLSIFDPEAVKSGAMQAYLATLPFAAVLMVLVAHLSQTFVGGWVVGRLGVSHFTVLAMIIAVLSMIGGAMNMMDIPLPAWMWVEQPLYVLTAWWGMRVARRNKALPVT